MLLAVQTAGDSLDIPARHLTRIVATFALPAAIGIDRESAVGVALNVVDVADWRVTVGVPAVPIPGHDQPSEMAVEAATTRITTDQGPTHRCGVEPPPPQLAFADGQNVAGDAGRQRPVAGQLRGGLLVGVEQ